MLIRIGKFDFTECWDGVLYKNLSNYPEITDWEIQSILDFIKYESMYGRTCELEAEKAFSTRLMSIALRMKLAIGLSRRKSLPNAPPAQGIKAA